MTEKVFVYGSLKTGFFNNLLFLQHSECLERDIHTDPEFCMYDSGCGYPYLIDGNYSIVGEVYLVNSHTLKDLDRLEGVSSGFYKRVQRNVGGHVCWVYGRGTKIHDDDTIVEVFNNTQEWTEEY